MLKSPKLTFSYFVKKEHGMFKVVMCLAFLLCSNLFAMQDPKTVVDEKLKAVRIAFFIDDHSERFGLKQSLAIAREFARTLSQNALHMTIVSNYVLKNMILRKYTKNPDPFIASLDLNLKNWNIYLVNNTQFFIFVPRDYNNPVFNKALWTPINLSTGNAYNGGESLSYPKISWADNAPIEAKRLLANENLKFIPYAKDINTPPIELKDPQKSPHKKFDPTQLSLIFTLPTKEVKTVIVNKKPFKYELYELNSLPPCNIYLMGHGRYSSDKTDITITGIPLDHIVNTLLFFNDKLNTRSVRVSSCYSGGKNLDLMQVKNDIPIRIKYMLIVDSVTDTPIFRISSEKFNFFNRVDQYFEALDNFQNSDESFSDKIKAIKSKSATPAELKSEIKKLEKSNGLNGILQTLSLLKIWYFLPNGPANFPQILIPEIGWLQTFNINPDIQKITNVATVKALAHPEFIKNEEVEIEPSQIKKVILKSRLEKMDFAEAGTIDINKKLALLLYPEIVSVNLNIIPEAKINTQDLYKSNATWWLINTYKYFPSIPCLDTIYAGNPIERNFYIYPEIISMQRGDSINLLAKINILNAGETPIETGILNFLRDSFLILRERKSEKIFFIKELEGFNDFSQILDGNDAFKKFLATKNIGKQRITLNNIFIKTSTVKLEGLVTKIEIYFEFGDQYWALTSLEEKFDLNQDPGLPANKSQSLWHFENSEAKYEEHITTAGLTFLAKLSPTEYYAQLPIIRNIFQLKNTGIKIKNPSNFLTLNNFIIGLTPEDIKKIRELTDYEQQAQLIRKLKRLKTSLGKLKHKLELLSSKLETLKSRLISTV